MFLGCIFRTSPTYVYHPCHCTLNAKANFKCHHLALLFKSQNPSTHAHPLHLGYHLHLSHLAFSFTFSLSRLFIYCLCYLVIDYACSWMMTTWFVHENLVFNVWVSKFMLMLQVVMCLHHNVYNILLKHVEQFQMDLINMDSKTLLKHCNYCFSYLISFFK